MNKQQFYCPTCQSVLEEQSSCGSISFFCDQCKTLISRSKMLSEDALRALDIEKEHNN